MTERDESGPAFPVAGFSDAYRGMSLREWYAGQALAAKTASGLIGYEEHAPEFRDELIRRLVRDCFEIADAMLAESGK